MEVLRTDQFADLGLPTTFAQVNQSRSVRGVVRGLHFQWDPPQGKLMRVVSGRAFMVAADIRPGSPTLGRVVTVEASADEPVLFWAPATFARGFAALSDVAEIEYFCTAPYNPASESAVRWDDPDLGIQWPVRTRCSRRRTRAPARWATGSSGRSRPRSPVAASAADLSVRGTCRLVGD